MPAPGRLPSWWGVLRRRRARAAAESEMFTSVVVGDFATARSAITLSKRALAADTRVRAAPQHTSGEACLVFVARRLLAQAALERLAVLPTSTSGGNAKGSARRPRRHPRSLSSFTLILRFGVALPVEGSGGRPGWRRGGHRRPEPDLPSLSEARPFSSRRQPQRETTEPHLLARARTLRRNPKGLDPYLDGPSRPSSLGRTSHRRVRIRGGVDTSATTKSDVRRGAGGSERVAALPQ